MTTNEQLAILGDNPGHREVALPLDSPSTTSALSEALSKAGAGSAGDVYEIHMHLDGINIADNDRSWNEVAKKIENTLSLRNQRGG